jgi:hypothetical protein
MLLFADALPMLLFIDAFMWLCVLLFADALPILLFADALTMELLCGE